MFYGIDVVTSSYFRVFKDVSDLFTKIRVLFAVYDEYSMELMSLPALHSGFLKMLRIYFQKFECFLQFMTNILWNSLQALTSGFLKIFRIYLRKFECSLQFMTNIQWNLYRYQLLLSDF